MVIEAHFKTIGNYFHINCDKNNYSEKNCECLISMF